MKNFDRAKAASHIVYTIIGALLICGQCISAQESQPQVFSDILDVYPVTRDFSMSANGKEVYVTVQSLDGNISQIVQLKKDGGHWQKPILLSFCDANSYLEPFLSVDEKRLYYVTNKPMDDADRTDFNIWFVSREYTNENWVDPTPLSKTINTLDDQFYPSLSKNGNLYYTMVAESGLGKDDIYLAKWDGSFYAEPENLSPKINTEGYEFNAFISPDEQTLIYTKYKAEGGLGSGDLYMSLKEQDGSWSLPKNLGEGVNSVQRITDHLRLC